MNVFIKNVAQMVVASIIAGVIIETVHATDSVPRSAGWVKTKYNNLRDKMRKTPEAATEAV